MVKLYLLELYIAIVVCMTFVTLKDYDNVSFTPIELYECNTFNFSTCILLWLFMFLINPIFFIIHFLDWLVHVGRKD